MKNAVVWDDLRVAAVAARVGTLSAAAARLELSVATVGRRLDRLEEGLGVRLFHRHPAGITATTEADALLSRADLLVDQIDELVQSASRLGAEAEGVVTVSTLETVVTEVVAPRLPRFRSLHPGVQLVLRSTARIVRVDRRAADLAIRVVRPHETRAVGRRLGALEFGLYAAPSYLEARGQPKNPAHSLEGHDVVMYDASWDGVPEMAWLRARLGEAGPAVRVTTTTAMAASVRSGAVLGVLPTMLASEPLVALVGPSALPSRELWLVMLEDLRDVPPVRAVADFLIEVFDEVFEKARSDGGDPAR